MAYGITTIGSLHTERAFASDVVRMRAPIGELQWHIVDPAGGPSKASYLVMGIVGGLAVGWLIGRRRRG